MPADRPARHSARRAVTIRDVAVAAGMHPSTISRSFDRHQRASQRSLLGLDGFRRRNDSAVLANGRASRHVLNLDLLELPVRTKDLHRSHRTLLSWTSATHSQESLGPS